MLRIIPTKTWNNAGDGEMAWRLRIFMAVAEDLS